jgi:hypothetical protein
VRDMGCYLEDYWAQVDTWAAKFSWRSAVGHFGTRGGKKLYGANDSVRSGTSNFTDDRRSGAKPWPCRKHCAILV